MFLVLCLASLHLSPAGISYSRLLSQGFGPSAITAMAVDRAGNVYLTGATEAAFFSTTPGVLQPKFGGGDCQTGIFPVAVQTFTCSDAFVIKLDPGGNVVFSTFLGGNGNDAGAAIAVDAAGNIYVAGTTSLNSGPSPPAFNFPVTPGAAFCRPSLSGFDGFVAKLNSSGTALIYATLIPGAISAAMAVDGDGNVYFGGSRSAVNFPLTPGAFETTPHGGIVAKLNPIGSGVLYATYLGGSRDDGVSGIAIDAAGWFMQPTWAAAVLIRAA